MNTRQTTRNRSELGMDNDSDEERDWERDEFERHRERDDERVRARASDRGKEREAMSRRVTGAESQIQPRGVGASKRTIQDGALEGTPPKRIQPETASSHTYATTGTRPQEPGARYRGTVAYT